jgi:hypothetical protein
MNPVLFISKNIKKCFVLFVIVLVVAALFNSCIVVKYEGIDDVENQQETIIELSPKSEIPISNNIVKSETGDFIAFLPEDWFFIEATTDSVSPIIAMAVNPDYSLGLVFSHLPKDNATAEAFEQEGIVGVGKLSFNQHQAKSDGKLKIAGKFKVTSIGHNSFCTYDMTAGSGINAKTAVLVTNGFNYYEIAMLPMNVKEKPVPSEAEFNKIFYSILTTVVY